MSPSLPRRLREPENIIAYYKTYFVIIIMLNCHDCKNICCVAPSYNSAWSSLCPRALISIHTPRPQNLREWYNFVQGTTCYQEKSCDWLHVSIQIKIKIFRTWGLETLHFLFNTLILSCKEFMKNNNNWMDLFSWGSHLEFQNGRQ